MVKQYMYTIYPMTTSYSSLLYLWYTNTDMYYICHTHTYTHTHTHTHIHGHIHCIGSLYIRVLVILMVTKGL